MSPPTLRKLQPALIPPVARHPLPEGNASPASYIQHSMWLASRGGIATTAYNSIIAFDIAGPLEVRRLEAALASVAGRHEILRTTLLWRGELLQVISPDTGLHPIHTESSALDVAIREEQQHRFSLERGPLLRARVIRATPVHHLLILNLHRMLVDLWSLGVLARELGYFYAADRSTVDTLTDPVQYADFSAWQRRRALAGGFADALAFWKRQLHGAPPVSAIPSDRPRSSAEESTAQSLNFGFPASLSDRIHRFAHDKQLTLYPVLAAALQLLLGLHGGHADVIVGCPVANRTRTALEGMLGFVANTLPIRTQFGDDPSFQTLVLRVWETLLLALEHKDCPFELLAQELKHERQPGMNPLFQVVLSVSNTPAVMLELEGLRTSVVPVEAQSVVFDGVFAITDGASLKCAVLYNSRLYDTQTIEHLLADYMQLLENALAAPERGITDILARCAFRSVNAPKPDSAAPTVAPEDRNPTSTLSIMPVLRDLWRAELGLAAIADHDDFFDLGGHSFLAIKMIASLRELYHIELGLLDLLDAPTVAGFATTIARLASVQP